MQQNDKNQFSYLQAIYNDARQEVKQRISQRDSFGVQMIVSIGVFMVAGFANNPFAPIAFLLLPFIVWYYVSQIERSYHIHERLCAFLRGQFADEYIKSAGYSHENSSLIYWERFSQCVEVRQKSAGIRKSFFSSFILVIPFIAETLFLVTSDFEKMFGISDRLTKYLLTGAVMLAAAIVYFLLIRNYFLAKRALKKQIDECLSSRKGEAI